MKCIIIGIALVIGCIPLVNAELTQIDKELNNAVRAKDFAAAKLALDNKANPNIPDYEHGFPLTLYALDRPDILRLLLQRGANRDALVQGEPLVREAKTAQALKVLLDEGLDPNTIYAGGETVLMLMEGRDRPAEMVKVLLERGAYKTMDKKDTKNGWTAFMRFVWGGEKEKAQLLLDAGADGNMKTEGGCTIHDILASGAEEQQNEPVYQEIELMLQRPQKIL